MILTEQIATYLYYLDLGIYSPNDADGNIYIDGLPEGEQKVSVYNRGGLQSDSKLGYRTIGVQVLYRGNKDPIASFEVANDIFSALQGFHSDILVLDGNYIVSILSTQAQPTALGVNENGSHEYSMNFLVEYKL